jgi:hypothetical protein
MANWRTVQNTWYARPGLMRNLETTPDNAPPRNPVLTADAAAAAVAVPAAAIATFPVPMEDDGPSEDDDDDEEEDEDDEDLTIREDATRWRGVWMCREVAVAVGRGTTKDSQQPVDAARTTNDNDNCRRMDPVRVMAREGEGEGKIKSGVVVVGNRIFRIMQMVLVKEKEEKWQDYRKPTVEKE